MRSLTTRRLLAGSLALALLTGTAACSKKNSGSGSSDKVIVIGQFKTNEQYGFSMAKSNKALQARINVGLQKAGTDGTYAKIYEKYFGTKPSGLPSGGGGPTTGPSAATSITVCSDTPYSPFEFKSTGSAKTPSGYTGFDIDLLQAVVGSGTKLNIKVTPFSGIIGSVSAGNCDLIASAMTITPERQKQLLFSDPYIDSNQSLAIREGDKDSIKGIADLKGKTVGVQDGTTGQIYAQKNVKGGTIKKFKDAPGLFAALKAGTIDAILQDYPVNAYQAKQDSGLIDPRAEARTTPR